MARKDKGFDDLIEHFDELEKKADEIDGENEVSFEELFTPSFMKKYTEYSSIEQMFESSPFKFETQEDFEEIPETELDSFIDANTQFPNWEEMKGKAGEEWTVKQLGF